MLLFIFLFLFFSDRKYYVKSVSCSHSTLHLLTHAIPLSPLPFSIPMMNHCFVNHFNEYSFNIQLFMTPYLSIFPFLLFAPKSQAFQNREQSYSYKQFRAEPRIQHPIYKFQLFLLLTCYPSAENACFYATSFQPEVHDTTFDYISLPWPCLSGDFWPLPLFLGFTHHQEECRIHGYHPPPEAIPQLQFVLWSVFLLTHKSYTHYTGSDSVYILHVRF